MLRYINLIFLMFLYACAQKEQEVSGRRYQPKVIAAIGHLVPQDSIQPPDTIILDESKLSIVPVGKPKIIPTNQNIHIAGKPKIVPANEPTVCTPGKGLYQLPEVIPVLNRSVLAKKPLPQAALPFRMKDNANCNIQYLDVDQGMNSSYVLSVLEDSEGNLWFGTGGGGVSRFDGRNFRHYTMSEGLSNNVVMSILEDKKKNIWFATNGGGVIKYDGSHFHLFNEKDGLGSNIVISMLEDRLGNIWFATYGGGVVKYDGNRVEDIISGIQDTKGIQESELKGVKKHNGRYTKSFTRFTEKQGLTNNMVRDILEDKNGNLWFVTANGGLNKYNGESFFRFNLGKDLNKSAILSIAEDRYGNIWLGTDGKGVILYNGNRVDEIQLGGERVKNRSHAVTQILPENKPGINLMKSFTYFTVEEGLSDNRVNAILEDKSGTLWFATGSGGICKYDGNRVDKILFKIRHNQKIDLSDSLGLEKEDARFVKTFTHYSTDQGLSNNNVFSFLEDKSGKLWVCTYGGGVNRFDKRSFTHFTQNEGLSNSSVHSMLQDKKGDFWFATDGDGLNKYDGKSFYHYAESQGLSNNQLRVIFEDRLGNLWWGTEGGGVIKYDGNRVAAIQKKMNLGLPVKKKELFGIKKINGRLIETFTNYTTLNGLANNIVYSIMEDSMGNLWFGTYGNGVSKYDGNRVEIIQAKLNQGESVSDQEIIGLRKVDGKYVKRFINYSTKQGLSDSIVQSIKEDHLGNIWFGTYSGGVCLFDGNRVDRVVNKSSTVKSKIEIGANDLIISNGKFIQSFRHFTEKEGLSNNSVFSMFQDAHGEMWIGTYGGGISKFSFNQSGNNKLKLIDRRETNAKELVNKKSISVKSPSFFSVYDQTDGISNNIIWSICQDNSGNMWIGTEKGINCLSKKEHKKSFSDDGFQNDILESDHSNTDFDIRIFRKEDGLKADDFYQNAVMIDNQNRMWWGSSKALTFLDLKQLEVNNASPEIYFEDLNLQGKFVDYNQILYSPDGFSDDFKNIRFNRVEKFHNYPLNPQLPYSLNYLTFHFNAIDWRAPQHIKYQYKLEGLDSKWSSMTIENQADYRGLPHGKYVFKVRALGISDKWSRTLEFPFEIMPPWWQTWWAYATYILLAIGCIIFYIRWRERALWARQQELEVKVDEATEVIRKQKDEVEKQKDVAEEQRKIAEDQKQVVEEQKKLVEEKNHEILSSIEYAKRIQTAILPPTRVVKEFFKNSFILYLPKDIVAGDFYWMESVEEMIYFAACDCTGHGVPGAMVSVVCNNALNRSLNEFSEREPGKIFDRARTLVLENFSKSDEDVKDGMDASLCALNLQSMELFWAGANNPLWIFRAQQNAIEEIKADKQPIGKVHEEKNFTTHRIALYHGDIIYLFTDGYADQFGGEKNKKLTKAKFRDLLLGMSAFSMEEQREKLIAFHDTYRGSNEQIDDICVMGVRV